MRDVVSGDGETRERPWRELREEGLEGRGKGRVRREGPIKHGGREGEGENGII